ncbi:MAG: putative Ig domain-containing protein [Bacteroidales bacterium]|nr:putative Ig domain-containing protein [Bacteroidales bacterium]
MRKLYIVNVLAILLCFSYSQTAIAAEAPYIAPISDQTAMIGELFTYDVDAVNADPAETYELLVARPGMSINSTTGLITWTPAQSGDGGTVIVRAFNSVGDSQRSFVVYLSDAIICAADLISYWKLDETEGSTYEDFKGGYTATSLTSLRDTIGKVDRGKVFAPLGKTDQFVYVTDEGQYDFPRSGGFSVSMWFNYKGQFLPDPNNQVLIARGSPDAEYDQMCYILMIDVSGGTPKISFSLRPKLAEELKTVTPNVTISQNQWYHVVAVYEGAAAGESSTLRVFINNQMFWYPHIFGDKDFIGDGLYDLNIGFWDRYESNRFPFNGSMDEILVYNKSLSSGEVNDIYNDGLTGRPHCKPGNYYPLFTSVPVDTATQDIPYTYTLGASDFDGDPLTLSAEIIPSWLTFNPSTGVLSGTPLNEDVGEAPVKLKATDGEIDIFQEFTITVKDVNDPPEFTSTPIIVANEEVAYTYFVEASDPDEDALTFTAEILPAWLTFNPSTKVLIGIPARENVGDNPVKIKVTDGEFEVFQEFIIDVKSGNNLPVITSTPPTIVDNYSEYQYLITAYDADAGDVLTFSAEVIPSWLSFNTETKLLSGIPEKQNVGDHSVILVVSDGFEEVKQEFTITVRDVNTAPQVISVPNDTAKVSLPYTYLMEVVDHEGSQLTFSGTVIPTWLTFDTGSKVLSGTPTTDNLGEHSVIITVTDGTFTVNHQFTVTVVPRWGVGIDPEDILVSRVYPNPANEYVIFELNSSASNIEVSDLSGKVMIHEVVEHGASKIQLDVSELSEGIYLFRIFDEDQYQTGKLIIN